MTPNAIIPRRNRIGLARLAWTLGAAAVFLAATLGQAQDRPPTTVDPRIGLEPGFRNAGEAARNMELVENLPKPEGFFDPEVPAGRPMPPDPPEGEETPPEGEASPPEDDPEAASDEASQRRSAGISFSHTDLAFSGRHVFVGNYHGFNTYREVEDVVEHPRRLELLASVVCPGGQGDLSVYGNLVFMSVEQTRGRIDCGTQGVEAPASAERFRGVRIFDISDMRNPQQIAAVQTCRGSHTHTLVTDPGDTANLYIYGSGTSAVRSAEELAGCSDVEPDEDPKTALFSIDVIQVPLAAPETARIINRPRIFADPETGAISGLWQGGDHGPGTQTAKRTSQCHDITAFPEVGLAAGACSGNGILMDISDPVNPVRLDEVVDPNFAFWHSATFNNDGSKVLFTDEWGGGGRPRCLETDLPTWGANALFDIVDRQMVFRGYYKMPAPQTEQENCVAHNGSLIPVPGRDIMVQAWYQGGVSVFDFTDSANPVEIAFFDRGPLDAEHLIFGGYWSTYWHNGYIYGSEISRGIDVFRLTPSEHLSQNEIDAAALVGFSEFNPQLQRRIVWPPSPVVARAYVDQLTRSNGIRAAHAAAVNDALDRLERQQSGTVSAAVLDELDALATELEEDARAVPQAAARLQSLAATITELTARLR
jgi:hypothetical protein